MQENAEDGKSVFYWFFFFGFICVCFKVYPCSTCGKVFKSGYHREKHLPVHEEKKPQKCQICGRVFTYKVAFMKHVRTHSEFVKTESAEGEEETVLEGDVVLQDGEIMQFPVKMEAGVEVLT